VQERAAGTLALDCKPTALDAVVRTCVEEQRLLTPERTIAIELLDAELATVYADADRLSQVITNYLTNAIRYSPEDQPIEVTVRVAGGVGRVEVRDHGRGIPEDEQESVWARFQRARSANEATGLGLGLYIARLIVELHGGWVGVESAMGIGSTFWLELPLADRTEPASERAHAYR
jgi:signal transduction histidine kinase